MTITKCGRHHGDGGGLAWWLVLLLGCVVDVEGGVIAVSLPEYTRMKKDPVYRAGSHFQVVASYFRRFLNRLYPQQSHQ